MQPDGQLAHAIGQRDEEKVVEVELGVQHDQPFVFFQLTLGIDAAASRTEHRGIVSDIGTMCADTFLHQLSSLPSRALKAQR